MAKSDFNLKWPNSALDLSSKNPSSEVGKTDPTVKRCLKYMWYTKGLLIHYETDSLQEANLVICCLITINFGCVEPH